MSKISQKILLAVSFSVTLLVVLFVSIVEWTSYKNSIADLKQRQQRITEAQAIMLSGFLQEKDQQHIYVTLSGILANPAIVAVAVEDHTGKLISSLGTHDSIENSYSFEHPITYFENDDIQRNGSITTWVSDDSIVIGVKTRVKALSWMVLLVVVSIALSIGITIREVVLRPLELLTREITNQNEKAPSVLLWHRNDEMGLLIDKFNQLNTHLHDTVDDLRSDIRDQAKIESERFKSLADATCEAIFIYQNGRVLDVNKAAITMFETGKSDLIGRDVEAIFRIGKNTDEHSFNANKLGTSRHPILCGQETERFVETTVRKTNYDGGKAFVATVRDLTDMIKSQEKIEYLAHHDHLTGLKNRFKIQTELQDHIHEVQAKVKKSLTVLSLDLDGFKPINDINGHAMGDEVLVQVGRRVKNVIGENDILGRIGGDEFIIGLIDYDSPTNLRTLMNDIIHQVSQPYQIQDIEITIGVSIGATIYTGGHAETATLLHQADLALYTAKGNGRGQFQLYHADMEISQKRQLAILTKLEEALNNEIIEVHFQPQADVGTLELLGFEALSRWTDAELGTITPDEFIPIAERNGLIRQLGQYVLFHACQAAALWPENIRIAVNISPSELLDPDLVPSIEKVLKTTGLLPHRLEIEITENVLIQNEEQTCLAMAELHKLGVTIAIDDFGTGYASLSYLQRYPVDRVKIDKMFVTEMKQNHEAAHIVRAITSLCNNLGIKVIAEGVETELEVQMLKREQCGEIQGYLVGRPKPMAEVDEYFTQTNNTLKNIAS